MLLADLDGDGDLDLAVANENSSNVSVLLGTGTGSFGAATSFSAGGGSQGGGGPGGGSGSGGSGGSVNATCADLTRNGSETAPDCGGDACPPCPLGALCGGITEGGELALPAPKLPPRTLRTGPSEFPCPFT